jgi:small subunit ribosomal protein S4e
MAKKGESKSLKRLNASRTLNIPRKRRYGVYVLRSVAGPHSKDTGIPLAVALRDSLGVVDTMREVKIVLTNGDIYIDGRTVKDPRFLIGFMDIVSIPKSQLNYRVLYDRKGRLMLEKIDKKEASFKLCRVEGKTMTAGGKLQLNFHDGRNCLVETEKKDVFNVGDVVKLAIPEQKVLDVYKLEKGSFVYITGGSHAGETGTVEELIPGTGKKESLVVVKTKERKMETPKDYVFVMGKDIKLGEGKK